MSDTVVYGWKNDTEVSREFEEYIGQRAGELGVYTPRGWNTHNGRITLRALIGDSQATATLLKSRQRLYAGTVTIPVSTPRVAGFWPAVWMVGGSHSLWSDNTWPQCGEIDIKEVPGIRLSAGSEPGCIANVIGGSSPATHWQQQAPYVDTHDARLVVSTDCDAFVRIRAYSGLAPTSSSRLLLDRTWRASDLPAGARWPFSSKKGLNLMLGMAVGGWSGAPHSNTSAGMTVYPITYRSALS